MATPDLEAELLRRAQSSDRAAMAQLLLLHHDALQRHIHGRLSRTLEPLVHAEDVLHQALVQASQAIRTYELRPTGTFRAWLTTIADNVLKNLEKRRHRERLASGPRPGASTSQQSGSWQALVERVAGDCTTPSNRGQRRENARRVRAALATLPEVQRQIVEAYYLEGHSLEQLAEMHGCSKGAIRGICYRARQRLRELMGRSSLYFSN